MAKPAGAGGASFGSSFFRPGRSNFLPNSSGFFSAAGAGASAFTGAAGGTAGCTGARKAGCAGSRRGSGVSAAEGVTSAAKLSSVKSGLITAAISSATFGVGVPPYSPSRAVR